MANKCKCGKEIEDWRTFCSRSCAAISQFNEREFQRLIILDPWFLSGETQCSLDIRQIKRFLISKIGNKCQECGWDKINPRTNLCPIEIEHINGDHKDNRANNLKLLCPNCHSLTPTYKSLNWGKGRDFRRQIPRVGQLAESVDSKST